MRQGKSCVRVLFAACPEFLTTTRFGKTTKTGNLRFHAIALRVSIDIGWKNHLAGQKVANLDSFGELNKILEWQRYSEDQTEI
ncbi:MAG: hypothetical protein A2283_17690 [Lentisphaerae bacterium RIFOXYA12_FULL_48_11]|nr:MAG: hypothetical protein A2283_17690 [Lentisphaerae bacterium RIFOXYA12_FULL_48_11]